MDEEERDSILIIYGDILAVNTTVPLEIIPHGI